MNCVNQERIPRYIGATLRHSSDTQLHEVCWQQVSEGVQEGSEAGLWCHNEGGR